MRRRLLGRLLPCGLVLLFLLGAGIFLAVKLPAALAPLAAGERLLSLCAGVYVLSAAPAESKPYRLLLLLVPWLGAAACFFLGREKDAPARPFAPFPDGRMNAAASLAAGCGLQAGRLESAEYFSSGKEMSVRLFADLGAAKKEILLDYYILARGRFFDTVLQILEQKAAEGVRVVLVGDGFGCAGLSRRFFRRLQARGIEAAVFRPLRPFAPAGLNLRDHRKLALIDRSVAYTGGVNLADEYTGDKIRFGHWKDTAVRLFGEACAQFAVLFGEKAPQDAPPRGTLPFVPFADGTGGRRVGEELLRSLISAAERTLDVCTPYFVPGDRLLAALCLAARSGVRVRLMLPHIPDKKGVFLLSRHYARKLAAAGGEVREYRDGFLHAKSIAADGEYLYIGSYNLDRRSLFTQAECGALLGDSGVTSAAARDFSVLWQTGVPLPRERPREKLLRALLLPFAPWI